VGKKNSVLGCRIADHFVALRREKMGAAHLLSPQSHKRHWAQSSLEGSTSVGTHAHSQMEHNDPLINEKDVWDFMCAPPLFERESKSQL